MNQHLAEPGDVSNVVQLERIDVQHVTVNDLDGTHVRTQQMARRWSTNTRSTFRRGTSESLR